jgi:hypothetical protein
MVSIQYSLNRHFLNPDRGEDKVLATYLSLLGQLSIPLKTSTSDRGNKTARPRLQDGCKAVLDKARHNKDRVASEVSFSPCFKTYYLLTSYRTILLL